MLRRQSKIRVQRMDSRSDRCQQAMLRLDLYRQPFRLRLPDGFNEYRTFTGSILSIFTICVVLAYASFKITTMVKKDDYKVRTLDQVGGFEETERFGEDNGFLIAAGIISIDTEPANSDYPNWRESRLEVPPEIGAFNLYYKVFDLVKGVRWKKIKTRWCEPEDFDAEEEPNPNSRFYRTLRTKGDVFDFGPHLRCPLESENFNIYGSY